MSRCLDCGFLSKRADDGRLLEITEGTRKEWKLNVLSVPIPFCAKLVVDFGGVGEPAAMSRVHAAVNKERECDKFTEWMPGFTPKEHAEMVHDEFLLKMQKDQHESDLKWRAEQERKTQERWQSENRLQKYSLIIIGIVGTVVLAAAQIVGSLIQAGYFKCNN
jgi:hypothetical protein